MSLAIAKAGAAEKVRSYNPDEAVARTKSGARTNDANSLLSLKGIPLYAHVSDLAGTKKPYVLPVPFMNVLNGGYVYETPGYRDRVQVTGTEQDLKETKR